VRKESPELWTPPKTPKATDEVCRSQRSAKLSPTSSINQEKLKKKTVGKVTAAVKVDI
jgi:hypothetical protein